MMMLLDGSNGIGSFDNVDGDGEVMKESANEERMDGVDGVAPTVVLVENDGCANEVNGCSLTD